jgi:hypothetical protein
MIENWPPMHRTGCRCERCRREQRVIERLADASLSTALRHAQSRFESEQGMEAATPRGSITLPGTFSGWLKPTNVKVLLGPSPPVEFTARSAPEKGYLYRIDRKHKVRPLYIGEAYRYPIVSRVASHVAGLLTKKFAVRKKGDPVAGLKATTARDFAKMRSEIEKLRVLLAKLPEADDLQVRYATVTPSTGYPVDVKLLHAFESALQVLEKPRSYVGSVRTFEDVASENATFEDVTFEDVW